MALPSGGKARNMARALLSPFISRVTPDADNLTTVQLSHSHLFILRYPDNSRERSTGAALLLTSDRLPSPPHRRRPYLGPLLRTSGRHERALRRTPWQRRLGRGR